MKAYYGYFFSFGQHFLHSSPLHFLLPLAILISSCARSEKTYPIDYSQHTDTSVAVYGPYRVVKLPITRGVKIANPIQLSLGPGGRLFASNQTGEVYTLQDNDGDGLEETASLYCNVKDWGLRSPTGFAHRGDTVYIGTAQEIRVFLDLDKDLKADTSWVFFNEIPFSEHPYEWTCGLTFGPDGWLYMAFTTDSWNAAPSPDPKGYRGALLKISPDGKKVERIATGIRSVYDLSFHPQGDLFFIDNEGGGNPQEELNLLQENAFYGHNPKKYSADSSNGPVHALLTEVAPSGIIFNSQDNDFGQTAGDLFISFYGPGERWNRGAVGRVRLLQNADGSYSFQEFPVADLPKLSHLAFGADGALYLAQHGRADYWYNAIYENEGAFYKLVYDTLVTYQPAVARAALSKPLSENAIEAGKQLFAEYACLGCHAVDGTTELLGPNLKDVARRLSRDEIMEEITKPSERIKPSMMAMRVVKKNGQVVLGRVVHADQEEISLMVIGNSILKIPRNEIVNSEDEKKSLMYEGLTNSMSATEKEALLDYIASLSITPAL